jgi:hypothetical protein
MDAFLDSIEPDFSDDEEEGEVVAEISILDLSGKSKPSVKTVIVASGAESVSVSHLVSVNTPTLPIYYKKTSTKVGDLYIVGQEGLLILSKPILFDPKDLFESYDQLVVLASVQDKEDGIHIISSDPKITTAIKSTTDLSQGISGMPAHLLTDSMASGNTNCTIIVNVHTSIRVEVDGIVGLWEILLEHFLQNNQDTTSKKILADFKKKYPVNRKFPLYS